MNNFNIDYPTARETELAVQELLTAKLVGDVLTVDVPDEKRSEFDFSARWRMSKNAHVDFEVKDDLKSEETGNIAIEFECYGKESGIKATKADYWVMKIRHDGDAGIYMMPVPLLRYLLLTEKTKLVTGGDDYAVRMFLLASDTFIYNAHRVDKAEDNSIHVRNWTDDYCTWSDFQMSL